LAHDPRLRAYVLAGLRRRWSPEQIVIRLRQEYPADVTMRVSHETIYRYLYVLPRGALQRELLRCLRTRRRYRRRRGATYTRRQLVEPVLIDHRPAEAADRTIPGHWEGDLLLGAARCSAAVGTLVERTTRFTVLVPVPHRHAPEAVCAAFARRMRRIPTPLRKTLTTDQGFEFAAHRALATQAAVHVYFCHPHSPWERGTNENTNGLLRQFFPKGCDFTRVSARQLRHVQDLLNERPRKALGGRTPKEVFYGLPLQPLLR
jgi:IS30 family transposase